MTGQNDTDVQGPAGQYTEDTSVIADRKKNTVPVDPEWPEKLDGLEN